MKNSSLKVYLIVTIIVLYVNLTEKNDEIKSGDELRNEYYLLKKIKNLVKVLMANYRTMNYEPDDESKQVNGLLVNLKRLNQELKRIFIRLKSGKSNFFNHKYLKMLRLIRSIMDELPKIELKSTESSEKSVYQKLKYYLSYGAASVFNLFTRIDCWICNLESLSCKFDKLQLVYEELKSLIGKHKFSKSPPIKRHRSLVERKELIVDHLRSSIINIRRLLVRTYDHLFTGYLYVQSKYANFTNQLCSFTHDYWQILIDKFNEFYFNFNFEKLNEKLNMKLVR